MFCVWFMPTRVGGAPYDLKQLSRLLSLELPPLVRSGAFFSFSVCRGDLSSFFCGGFRPFSKVGNS